MVNGVENESGDYVDDDDENPEMQSAHAKIVDAIAKKSSSDTESIEQVSGT